VKASNHPLVDAYLREFDLAAVGLPLPRRRELRKEIRAHLAELIPPGLDDDEAKSRLAYFGSPAGILDQEAAMSPLNLNRTKRASRKRPAALVPLAAVIATAIVAVLFLTSSAPSQSIVNAHPKGLSRVTSGDAYFDYIDTIKTIKQPLPPGATYPVGVPGGLNSGAAKTGDMEFGGGSDTAHFTWLCAWETEYLADVKDRNVSRRVTAENMLIWWGNSAWWRIADPTHGWNQNVVDPMKLGITTGVRDDVNESCMQAGISN
jgi:hypothetical protein